MTAGFPALHTVKVAGDWRTGGHRPPLQWEVVPKGLLSPWRLIVVKQYRTFEAFYPYYLSEHSNRTCRRLHFLGAILIAVTLLYTVSTKWWWGFLILPVWGYGLGGIGHAFFEKNTPTTSTYPLYSFCAYWIMIKDIAIGRLKF